MSDQLAQQAIEEALSGNWKQAQKLNEKILAAEPNNSAALNRLARTCFELGKFPKAQTCYKKVLKLDPYNPIAQKALERLKKLKTNGGVNPQAFPTSQLSSVNLFIEEPGKTKPVNLIHLGDPVLISMLDAGEEVALEPHAHRVSVLTLQRKYIGRLPDDLSRHLIKLTKSGYVYKTVIRSVTPDCIKIFIRETGRPDQKASNPSFPLAEKAGYVSFTHPDSIHEEKPDVSPTEDVDDLEL